MLRQNLHRQNKPKMPNPNDKAPPNHTTSIRPHYTLPKHHFGAEGISECLLGTTEVRRSQRDYFSESSKGGRSSGGVFKAPGVGLTVPLELDDPVRLSHDENRK